MDGAQEISEGDRREEIQFACVDPIQEEPLVLAGHARDASDVTGVEREDEDDGERYELGFHDLFFLQSRRPCRGRNDWVQLSDDGAFCAYYSATIASQRECEKSPSFSI